MSSNSKAKTFISTWDQIYNNNKKTQDLYNQIRLVEGPREGTRPILGTAPGSVPSGTFLRHDDAVLTGIFSYTPKTVSLSSTTLDVSRATLSGYTSRLILANSLGFDLEQIDGAEHAGQYLEIQGVLTESITVKHGVSNIRTQDGADVTITGNQVITLRFDSIANEWVVVTTPTSSSGFVTNPMTADLDAASWDILNIDRATFTVDSGAMGSPSDKGLVAATFGLRYNVGSGLSHRIDIAGVNEYSFGSGSQDYQGNSLNDVNDIAFTVSGINILTDTSGMQFLVDNSDNFQWLIGGALSMQLGVTQLDIQSRQLVDVNDIKFANVGLEIRDNTGGLEYDVNPGDDHEFKISSIDEFTVGVANINFRGNDAFDVGDIDFAISGQTLLSDTSGLHMFLPAGDIFEIFINSTKIFDVDFGGINLAANMDFVMSSSSYMQFGSTSSSASAGAVASPGNYDGFFWVKDPSGSFKKVPFYNP